MSVTHVIFDFDGLLVDTESSYTLANKMLFRKFGLEFTPEYNAMILGRKRDEGFPLLLKAAGLDGKITVKEYTTQFYALMDHLFRECKAMPGAEKLVRHLHKKANSLIFSTHRAPKPYISRESTASAQSRKVLKSKGVPMAICTGSRSKTFGPRREPHKEWLDLIPLKVFCGDEPQIRGKPNPDPFIVTMNRFSVKPSDPSKVLVFEDSPNGGRSAKAAGMKCIIVPTEQSRQEAISIGVAQVLHSLEEFRPEMYGLPPYE
ncbi:unnamed protein product [Cylicocyclus nassatus]|uniref:Uncharacterized protein n=1 Tax=Cylicocyclus nassatus TaxID=53992 RepID=A0AA36M702_CYLNA|nr:unnamed protein product [Cylicocyclus nassatus]